MGVRVEIEEGERIGPALRRLKKKLVHAGVLYRLTEREWRLTEPSEARRWQVGKAKHAAQRAGYRKRRQLGIP